VLFPYFRPPWTPIVTCCKTDENCEHLRTLIKVSSTPRTNLTHAGEFGPHLQTRSRLLFMFSSYPYNLLKMAIASTSKQGIHETILCSSEMMSICTARTSTPYQGMIFEIPHKNHFSSHRTCTTPCARKCYKERENYPSVK
jgi:hypothetical protein